MNETRDWKKRFGDQWVEEAHKQLDACGFEKDNQDDVSKQSTTKRSEALAFQAMLYAFALKYMENEMEGTLLPGQPIRGWLNKQIAAGIVRSWHGDKYNDRRFVIEFI